MNMHTNKIIYICFDCGKENVLDFIPQEVEPQRWDDYECQHCGKKRSEDPVYKEPFIAENRYARSYKDPEIEIKENTQE